MKRLLLGALLFWAQGRIFPEPRPVIGPLADARIDALVQQWFSAVGRAPSDEQLARMIQRNGMSAAQIKAGCGRCGACSALSAFEKFAPEERAIA